MGMLLHGYTSSHQHEVYNPPAWVFTPDVSMSCAEAARALGMSKSTFMRYIDAYGLTVYRHPRTDNRYFLISEIETLKELRPTITPDDIAKAMKGNGKRGYGILRQVQRKKGKAR